MAGVASPNLANLELIIALAESAPDFTCERVSPECGKEAVYRCVLRVAEGQCVHAPMTRLMCLRCYEETSGESGPLLICRACDEGSGQVAILKIASAEKIRATP